MSNEKKVRFAEDTLINSKAYKDAAKRALSAAIEQIPADDTFEHHSIRTIFTRLDHKLARQQPIKTDLDTYKIINKAIHEVYPERTLKPKYVIDFNTYSQNYREADHALYRSKSRKSGILTILALALSITLASFSVGALVINSSLWLIQVLTVSTIIAGVASIATIGVAAYFRYQFSQLDSLRSLMHTCSRALLHNAGQQENDEFSLHRSFFGSDDDIFDRSSPPKADTDDSNSDRVVLLDSDDSDDYDDDNNDRESTPLLSKTRVITH